MSLFEPPGALNRLILDHCCHVVQNVDGGIHVARLVIQPMQAEDWVAVRRIYGEGLQTGQATFEQQLPTWESWDAGHLKSCRLVARTDGVVGWAALSPISGRGVYIGVAEASIYVCQACRGEGVGHQLLQSLIDASEEEGLWTLQASIFPENTASVALHKKLGFREVGRRERIGQLHGVWRDVLLCERRSTVTGID